MRALYVILLCVLFVGLGFVFMFKGTIVLPSPSLATQVRSAQADSPPADATSALACIQNALGGERAFANVSSLRITADTRPIATTGLRPLPGTREISMVFPDRYKRVNVGQPRSPGASTLRSVVGFDGPVMLTSPGVPPEGAILRTTREDHARRLMRIAREDFVRQMLMRLPRVFADFALSERVIRDAGQERLALEVSGADGFRATLLADLETCVPLALQYTGVSPTKGFVPERADLSEYREFDGIRFATLLKISQNGEPFAEERVSDVELNAPDAAEYFAPDR